MLYKTLNKIFGYDYIAWANSADQGIARVHLDALGNPYYWRYKITKLPDKITDAGQVMWLTCLPSKYLKENTNE